jgi:hypothetical protein
MPRWIHSRWIAFAIAVGTGVLIWAASPRVTGEIEPWDADGFYYVGALILAGLGIGLLAPTRGPTDQHATVSLPRIDVGYLLALYAGILGGQLGYAVSHIPGGPLWVLGVGFLAAYSALSVFAAIMVGVARHTIAK